MGTLRRAIAVRIARNVSENGAPELIRTADPQIRSLVLYPAERRALIALPVNWTTTGPGRAVVLIPPLRNGIPFRAWGSVLHGYFTIRIRNAWAG